MTSQSIETAYALARQRYADVGVDTDAALRQLSTVSISLHCWQGDDVGGFEQPDGRLGGGLAATGNYPGKARTPDELRRDAAKALSLIPGTHRFNLHAVYGEFGTRRVDRDAIGPEHFAGWIDWAKSLGIGLDFNPTCFSHPKAADNFTLSHPDRAIRSYWIRHAAACRRIGAEMGKALGTRCRAGFCTRWTPVTIIRPKPSRTRSARSSCSFRKSCCTSAAAYAGTATTSSSSTTILKPSVRSSSAATFCRE